MTDGRTRRWEGHRDQRRADFVESALLVIAREGPLATVDQIAAEQGVTRQALYRQFADRAELDRAIAFRAADLLLEALLPTLELTGEVGATIRTATDAYLNFVLANLALYRFVRSHEASAVEGVKGTVSSRVAAIATDYLMTTGVTATATAGPFAAGVVGLADAVISGWLDEPGELSRQDLVEQLVVMVGGVVHAVVFA
jgi:AcrR family transcriptional regulator